VAVCAWNVLQTKEMGVCTATGHHGRGLYAGPLRGLQPGDRGAGWQCVRGRYCIQREYVSSLPPDTAIDALTLVLFVPGYRESVVQGGSLRMESVANKGNGCVYCHRTPRSWPLRWSSSRPATRRSWCRVAVCAWKALQMSGMGMRTATGHHALTRVLIEVGG